MVFLPVVTKMRWRSGLTACALGSLAAAMATSACKGEDDSEFELADPGVEATYSITPDGADKSKMFPLVGRWYPISEVKRLSDPTLSAKEWCARGPARTSVELDQVRVTCETTMEYVAPIARVMTSTLPGDILLEFRAGRQYPLQELAFTDRRGSTAIIIGNPCYGYQPALHQRFPEYEILTRAILRGRRCSQIVEVLPSVDPTPPL